MAGSQMDNREKGKLDGDAGVTHVSPQRGHTTAASRCLGKQEEHHSDMPFTCLTAAWSLR
jgi:hypothetical protein